MLRSKFVLLREQPNEGGGGGGEMPQMSERERALEARVNQLDQTLRTMREQSQSAAQQSQIAQATAQVERSVSEAEAAVNSAETALSEALESGDPLTIAKAQRALADSAAAAERKRADRDAFKQQIQQSERRDGGQRRESATAQPQLDTTNLQDWKNRHASWYGVDPEMTRVSHEIDASIRQAGQYTVGSKEYFNAIDAAMRTRFPNRFSGAPASASARGEGGQQTNSPRRYDRDIQRSMDAFGLSPEAWDKARQKAVEKGFLSADPARGRVMQ